MGKSFLHALALCFVLLSGSCLASRQSSPQSERGECDVSKISPIEAKNRIQHEAGYSETWDQKDEQLKCSGVNVDRHVIHSKGVLIPAFYNAPSMYFVLQGKAGIAGLVFPGCPETFQSFQKSLRDQHQKIQKLKRGDAFPVPAGIVHWVYNDGNDDLVLLVVHDLSNRENQLDQNLRRFFLGGNQQGGEQPGEKSFGTNIFRQLDVEFFSRASGLPEDVVRKLWNEEKPKGFIVRARQGLRFVNPGSEKSSGGPFLDVSSSNGYEETICTQRFKDNLVKPDRADIYTAKGGSISTLNSYTLPILSKLGFSAGRGYLFPSAMVAPYWNVHGHSVSYVSSGTGRVQITGDSKKSAYDGEVRQGQLFIVPQNFVSMKQAGQQGLEWYTFKTAQDAKANPLIGRTGAIRAVPLDVWVNVHNLTENEAKTFKYSTDEITILVPKSGGEQQQPGGYDQRAIL